MRRPVIVPLLIATAMAMAPRGAAWASYGIYVGKNLTADGSVFLGGTGDEPSSHWLEIVPRKKHAAGETIRVGVDKEANYPGEFIQIPQVPLTAKYVTMNYSEFEGFPAPITNGGLNEYGVAARDIWSPSRKELARMTPNPQHGPSYSDLSRLVMERAHSAHEAVEIVGQLIDKYGYSTYGGNSHFFADSNEGWILIDFAGGKGLWIAERVGPDDIRMSYPGYILDIPLDFQKHPDKYRGSANFISFAIEHGWYDPHSGKPFNVNQVYQEGKGRQETVQVIEERLRQKVKTGKLTLREFMDTVRDPLISKDWNGYGQVAHLRQGILRPEFNMLWVAATGSITTPFVPYWIGVDKVIPEFGKHRYLSHREAEGFVTKDFQIQEASRFAMVTFKRLMYYTCDKPDKFLPEVTEALAAFENQSIAQVPAVEALATKLFDLDEPGMAEDTLTRFSSQRAKDAMTLGDALLGSIEARYRLLYGFRAPTGAAMSGAHGRRDIVSCAEPMD
jgi:dipeptidase